MVISKKKNLKILLFIFLVLHVVPLINRNSYRILTLINYATVLPFILLLTIYKRKINALSIVYFGLILISFFLYFLGYSGTVSALILGATTPYFMYNAFHNKKDFLEILFFPVFISSIFLLIAGYYLYFNLSSQLTNYLFLGEYFGIASINYVSLIFFSFSILLFFVVNEKNKSITSVKKKYYYFGVLLFMIISSILFSYAYLTRSTLITSIALLFVCFRKYWMLMAIAMVGFLVINKQFYAMIFDFMGGSHLVDIVQHGKREDSVMVLIQNSMSLNLNFRDYMSYSSLLNLFFSLFPFTFIFIFYLINILKSFEIRLFSSYSVLMLAIVITIYQMDFLSLFMVFFIVEFIKLNKIESTSN